MPTLRQRFATLLLGNERRQLAAAIGALAEARRYVRAPGPESLAEVDAQLIDLLLQQSGWTRGGGMGYGALELLWNEPRRQSTVVNSRWMYNTDVFAQSATDMWTDFGFGQHVTITPTDPTLAEIVSEFWEARRNQAVLGEAQIHENSTRIIVDGEFFFTVWASTLDGLCTLRRLDTDRIFDVICDPQDPDTPLWYIQHSLDGKTIYYPDWSADPLALAEHPVPENAQHADTLRPETRVVVIPAQRNRIGKRGWPQLKQALAWAKAYSEFLGDRATVAKKAALRVEKLIAKNAGQRQIDDIVARLQSSFVNEGAGMDTNQNRTAGQTWVQNEAVDLQWMNRDTGAQAAQIDGLTLAGQFAAGARVPLGWLGRPDAWQNRAVAKESSLPWYEQIQRYQTFWTSTFSILVEVVGRMANEHGGKSIDDFTTEVGLDSPFQNDIAEIAEIMGAITNAAASGALDPALAGRANQEFTRLALMSLGMRDPSPIMELPEGETPDEDDNGLPDAAQQAVENFRKGKLDAKRLVEYFVELAGGNGNHK